MKMKLEKLDRSSKVHEITRLIISQKGDIMTMSKSDGLVNEGNISEFGAIVVGTGKDMVDTPAKPAA